MLFPLARDDVGRVKANAKHAQKIILEIIIDNFVDMDPVAVAVFNRNRMSKVRQIQRTERKIPRIRPVSIFRQVRGHRPRQLELNRIRRVGERFKLRVIIDRLQILKRSAHGYIAIDDRVRVAQIEPLIIQPVRDRVSNLSVIGCIGDRARSRHNPK